MKIKQCGKNVITIELENETMIISIIGFGRLLQLDGNFEVTITFKKKS